MFFIFFFLILICRSNSSLLGYEFLNTDEFVIGAKALRLVNSNFNFYEFDGDTSGVLNALFLVWPSLLGLDITYLSIRISAILAITISVFIIFKTLSLFVLEKEKYLIFLPILIFFCLTKDADFLHYTNELVTVTLILSSLYFYLKNYQNLQTKYLFLIGTLSGAVIFAKMQFFPISLFFILMISLKLVFYKKDYLKFILLSISFLIPSFMISIYYYYNNEFLDLFNNVIHYPLADFIVRNTAIDNIIVEKNDLGSILQSEKRSVFFNHLIFNSIFHLFYFYLIYLAISIYFSKNIKKVLINHNFNLILVGSLIVLTFIVILVTGSVHRHYLVVLAPMVPIFLAMFVKNIDINLAKRGIQLNLITFFFTIFILSLILEKYKFYNNNFFKSKFLQNNINFESPKLLQHLNIDGDDKKLMIWGWKPELYLLSSFTPSTRDSVNQKQIDNKGNRNYFRDRLLKDLNNNEPFLIIDYVKSNGYFFNDESTSGLSTFIRLKKIVDSNYKKINKGVKNCPDYFLRNKEYFEFKEKINKYEIKSSDIKNLNYLKDLNIDEDMCTTGVYFSKNSPNQFTIIPEQKKITEIKILASKVNKKNVSVTLNFYNQNKIISEKEIVINKYPFWSNIKIDGDLVPDEIKIDLNELNNNNFGLSEIIIF
tara:strand:- start:1921 stop:3882 length:1962 start_codon:yes stop_codon:yes gene_type:complete